MSLDNDFVFSKKVRRFLFSKLKIMLTLSLINIDFEFFLLIINFIENKTLYIFILIPFIIVIATFVVINLRRSRKKFYASFLIIFAGCQLFSGSILLCFEFFNWFAHIKGMPLHIDDMVFYFNGMTLFIYSLVIGIFLLSIDEYINTVLFPYISDNYDFKIDTVSNRFAIDVLSYAVYLGILFGLIVYDFFLPKENKESFFSAVNITHIALAVVGVVTFFWAAKSVKSKSIELDITRSREVGHLFSEGTVFLSTPYDDKKYVGLFYLNMIAGQSKGPLQKEAIHLMKDFILNANDITTANKQRIRAMEYLSDRLKTDFLDDDIDELIELSSSELTESNANYRFSQLNVIYENFNFSNDEKYLRYKLLEENKIIKKNKGIWSRLIRKNNSKLTEDDNCKLIGYNNCNFENYSGQNGIEKIILVYANNCRFKKCKIGIVKGYSKKPKTWSNTGQKGEFTPLNNKFEQCDFSDSDGWNILRPSDRMEGEIAETVAENAFINCFYYSGHEPEGFVKERDGALLTEITSKEQFDELIGSSSFMQYAPPDD